jgi:hypothetical protein
MRPIISDSLFKGYPVSGGLSVDSNNNVLYVAVADAELDLAYMQSFNLNTGKLINTFPLPDDVRYDLYHLASIHNSLTD